MKTILLILGLMALPALVGYYFTSKKGTAYSRPAASSHNSSQGGSGYGSRR